jgi:beta-N-acetylhexosaminidase
MHPPILKLYFTKIILSKGITVKQYLLSATFVLLTWQINSMELSTNNLTLDQKIGQLFMVATVADEEVAKDFLSKKSYRMDKEYITELITQYHIGGIIYLGKSDTEKQIERTQYFQNISAIPLLIGQDLEPGRVGISRLQAMECFFNNKALGELNEKDKTYKTGFKIGQYCKKLGVHINFAPVADVNNNPNNPVINDRSFGDNPELVTQHAIAFAQGLRDAGIIACAKHFPGHGDTTVDSHFDLPLITHDKNRLHAIELYPFKKLIAENIPAIMVGHLEVPAFEEQPKLPSSLSKKIVTDLLQKELGFTGLVITDSLHMYGVTKYFNPGEYELYGLLAGNDILLCPFDVPAAVAAIKQAITDNRVSEEAINAHVEKILRVKNSLQI